MELYLQFGHGMMSLCIELVEGWGQGTVILSPRDLDRAQLVRMGSELRRRGGCVLLDPQCFLPRADHHRLVRHDYWPQDFDTGAFGGGPVLCQMLRAISQLEREVGCKAHILPALYASRVDDVWVASQEAVLREAASLADGLPTIATVCLSGETLRFQEQVQDLLENAEHWQVDGFYVVAEHPNGGYLVDDPAWLANLLDLCAGLKLLGRKVIVGYCNQQELCLAAANVDAIASGTWMNVRSFPPEKFWTREEEQKRRRAWYYCPQALSEFTVPFLDMAYQAGILSYLQSDASLGSGYGDVLFSGTQPSTTEFSERHSFRHYLCCLRSQAIAARRDSFRETVRAHLAALSTAEHLLDVFHRAGVLGQHRDFAEIVAVNRSAVTALENARGFVLDRAW